MTELALLASEVVVVLGLVVLLRYQDGRRQARSFEAYRLQFPPDVSTAAATAFIGGLAGLLPSRLRRLFGFPVVIFEVTADKAGIDHHLLVSDRADYVLGQLRSALPGVRVTPDPDHRFGTMRLGAELCLNTIHRPLTTAPAERLSAALLSSLQPLRGEQVIVQTVVAPGPPVEVRKPVVTRLLGRSQVLDRDAAKAARQKRSDGLFMVSIRVGVAAKDRRRARQILVRVLGAFHTLNAPGVHLRRRLVPDDLVARRIERRYLPVVEWPLVLNTGELMLAAFIPVGGPTVTGLYFVRGRYLPPSPAVPSSGLVIGDAIHFGTERPLALSQADSLRHLWVLGPTGVGKSVTLANLAVQAIAAGRGVCVVDPKTDLIDDILDRIPAGREGDVIVLDPADVERPVGINLLAGATADPELVADQVLTIFRGLWSAFWGPRTQDLLHGGLLTLATDPRATLVDLPLLLLNDNFRRRLVGRLDDPIALGPFWAAYEAMSPGERAQAVGPPLNKIRQLVLRPRLRAVLGQADPTFTFSDVLNNRKVLLVSLAAGVMGEEAAALVGALVVARLWQAIQGRAALPQEHRQPATVFLDEFQTFTHLPTDLGNVLALSRGLGTGWVLAHQHIGQLPPQLRQAVVANARSKITFQTAAADAAVLARELGPEVQPADLQSLAAYEAVAALSANAEVTAGATIRTRPLPEPLGTGEQVRALSRQRYGRDRAEVDAAIRARYDDEPTSGPLTRRRRTA